MKIPEIEHNARSYSIIDKDGSRLQDILNELGRAGWEIGTVLRYVEGKEIALIVSRPTGRKVQG